MTDPQAPGGVLNRRYRVSGRVQGVGFRYATLRSAESLGLTGWVRNLADGDVEAEAHGELAVLERFESWLHEGPDHARVAEVTVTEVETRSFGAFRIER